VRVGRARKWDLDVADSYTRLTAHCKVSSSSAGGGGLSLSLSLARWQLNWLAIPWGQCTHNAALCSLICAALRCVVCARAVKWVAPFLKWAPRLAALETSLSHSERTHNFRPLCAMSKDIRMHSQLRHFQRKNQEKPFWHQVFLSPKVSIFS